MACPAPSGLDPGDPGAPGGGGRFLHCPVARRRLACPGAHLAHRAGNGERAAGGRAKPAQGQPDHCRTVAHQPRRRGANAGKGADQAFRAAAGAKPGGLDQRPRHPRPAAAAGRSRRLRLPAPVLFPPIGRRRLFPRSGEDHGQGPGGRAGRLFSRHRPRPPADRRTDPRRPAGPAGGPGGGVDDRRTGRHSARHNDRHTGFRAGPFTGHFGASHRAGGGDFVHGPARRAGPGGAGGVALSDQEMGGVGGHRRRRRLRPDRRRHGSHPTGVPDDRPGAGGGAARPAGTVHAHGRLGGGDRVGGQPGKPSRPQFPDVIRRRRGIDRRL